MALFDMPLDRLREYLPDRVEPADFDDFWATTLANAEAAATDPVFTPVETGLATVEEELLILLDIEKLMTSADMALVDAATH